MNFLCKCGHVIRDQTDSLTYKADLLPDNGGWDNFHEPIVKGILDFARSIAADDRKGWLSRNFGPDYPRDLDDEATVSDFLSRFECALRKIYQCTECGALFIEKSKGGEFVMFSPAGEDWKGILKW